MCCGKIKQNYASEAKESRETRKQTLDVYLERKKPWTMERTHSLNPTLLAFTRNALHMPQVSTTKKNYSLRHDINNLSCLDTIDPQSFLFKELHTLHGYKAQ